MDCIKNKDYEEFTHSFNIPFVLQNFDKILIENGYEHLAKNHLNKFYYLIHKFNQGAIEDKSIKDDAFIILHSQIMGRLLGFAYYKPILTAFCNLGIIEEGFSYQTDCKSKGYRLTPQFRNLPSSYITRIDYEGSFLHKLTVYYQNKILYFINKNQYKAAYQNLITVNLDKRKTISVLKAKCRNLKLDSHHIPSSLCPYELEHAKNKYLEIKSEASIKMAHWLSAVIRIERKDWTFTVDEKGYRLHTNISVLPKKLRKCILLDNNNYLIEIDIPSSQLLFLGVLLKRRLGKEYWYSEDLVRFIDDVINQDMYLNIGYGLDRINRSWNSTRKKKERDKLKPEVFKCLLFGKIYLNEFTEYFQTAYPTLLKFIKELKEVDYRHSSILLQKTESSFIFGSVIKDLISQIPDIKFLTVHDSIICKREDAQFVHDTMVKCFFNKYHETIRLKIEPPLN